MQKSSLWLIPQEIERQKYSKSIDRLAEEYSSPEFIPHITLIPGLIGNINDISKYIIDICRNISPIKMEIDRIDMTDNYWRSVFFKIKIDDNLLDLYDKVKSSLTPFISNIDKKYFPHLSLIYGEFPQEVKNRIVASVNSDNLPQSFMIDQVYLLKMENKKPSEWRISGAYKFHND